MSRPSIPRLLIGSGGVILIGVGLFNALALELVDLLWLAFWLGAGLVAHDAMVAPATAGLSKLAADRWPAHGRRVLVIATVTIGPLTLIALPLIQQQGAVPGTPTLLGRNYLAGWAAACLLVLIGAAVAEVVSRVRAKRDSAQSTAQD